MKTRFRPSLNEAAQRLIFAKNRHHHDSDSVPSRELTTKTRLLDARTRRRATACAQSHRRVVAVRSKGRRCRAQESTSRRDELGRDGCFRARRSAGGATAASGPPPRGPQDGSRGRGPARDERREVGVRQPETRTVRPRAIASTARLRRAPRERSASRRRRRRPRNGTTPAPTRLTLPSSRRASSSRFPRSARSRPTETEPRASASTAR